MSFLDFFLENKDKFEYINVIDERELQEIVDVCFPCDMVVEIPEGAFYNVRELIFDSVVKDVTVYGYDGYYLGKIYNEDSILNITGVCHKLDELKTE